MNVRAMLTEKEEAINTVYNVACGDRIDLNNLVLLLKKYLSQFDPNIMDVNITYGPSRKGDVPHSLASIEKAKKLLGYNPSHNLENGLKEAIIWYWKNLKK